MLSKFLKFIAVIIILIAIAAAIKFFIFKKDYNTFTVKKGGIINSISANGFVVSNLISDLYFDASGKIEKINFQANDEIKRDDILAELEAAREKKHLAQAKKLKRETGDLIFLNSLPKKEVEKIGIEMADLEIALGEIQLNNMKGIGERDIKIAELKIQSIQNILNNSQAELLNAEERIKNVKNIGENKITESSELLINTIQDILLNSSSTLAYADNILGIDNKEANDQFEEYLGVLKRGVLKNSKLAYKQAIDDYLNADDNFNLFKKNNDLDIEKIEGELEEKKEKIDIMPTVELAQKLLLSIDSLLFKTRILLNNTKTYEIAPSKKKSKKDAKKIFTKNELSDFKSMIDGIKIENSEKINLLKNQKESLLLNEKNLLLAQKKEQNEHNKINLNCQKIKKTLDEMQKNLIQIKDNNNDLIEITELKLNEKRKDLTLNKKIDIKKLPNKAEKLLSLAQKNLSDTKLKAPNNCIITGIKAKIGDDISPSQIFAIAISTQVIIEASISESDINKIKIGQKTIFDFAGNLKSEEKKAGKIIAIDLDNKKIKAALDEYGSNTIRFGMPINSTVIIAKKENTLFIPLNAIIEDSGRITVKILQNKKIQDKKIKTGIIGNNNMVEIISGLNKGEEVIIF